MPFLLVSVKGWFVLVASTQDIKNKVEEEEEEEERTFVHNKCLFSVVIRVELPNANVANWPHTF